MKISSVKKHFRLKQIVKKPTRKNAILDLILTKMKDYYENPCVFPPFGLSDHNVITAEGKQREYANSSKFIYTRDKRASRKAEMGRFLSGINWSTIFSSLASIDDLVNAFNSVVHTELDVLMPKKKFV